MPQQVAAKAKAAAASYQGVPTSDKK